MVPGLDLRFVFAAPEAGGDLTLNLSECLAYLTMRGAPDVARD